MKHRTKLPPVVGKPRRSTGPARQAKREAWARARREEVLMYGPPEATRAETIAAENLRAIDKPRKRPPRTWLARPEDVVVCAKCHLGIEEGQRVHRRPSDGRLVHHRHDSTEPTYDVCGTCWMVTPCDCD